MNTKIATFAAIALTAALLSGFVYSAPSFAQALAQATLDNQNIAPMTASQKVRCIMPVAQQKFCGVE